MAVKVRTYSELLKELKKVRNKALEGAGEKARDLVKEEIQKEVYNIPEGAYERTGELKESLIDFPLEEKGDIAQVAIKHDWENLMTATASKFQHASPYWSPWNYRPYVARTVHDGLSGGLFGTSENLHWRKPKPYMDNAKETLRKGKYKEYMKEELVGMGYKVR